MSSVAGFQYTPPSYLIRASDTTNRPWSKTEEGEGHIDDTEYTGDNEYDLPQEQRPQTRRESHLDAHFQQRVRNKQSRYRDILKGDAEQTTTNTNTNKVYANDGEEHEHDDDEDSLLLAAANADSYADVHSARIHAQSSRSHELARKNRKERITGVSDAHTVGTTTRRSESASDAETARSLRAQRLRSSLLKQTPDEFDVQTKLEMRRLARKEEEAAARKSERESTIESSRSFAQQKEEQQHQQQHQPPSLNTSKAQERKAMQQERKVLQAEREALAIAKEEAALALMRASELNDERIRQRELDARLEADRIEEERVTKRRERAMEAAAARSSKQNQHQQPPSYYSTSKKNKNRKQLKTKNFGSGGDTSSNTDGDTFMTEFDAENDFAFLNDLTGIIRDTGLMKTCGACFGDTDNVLDPDDKETIGFTCAGMSSENISSVFVPDLVASSDNSASDNELDNINNNNNDDDRTNDSIRRSRVYAKYRA